MQKKSILWSLPQTGRYQNTRRPTKTVRRSSIISDVRQLFSVDIVHIRLCHFRSQQNIFKGIESDSLWLNTAVVPSCQQVNKQQEKRDNLV